MPIHGWRPGLYGRIALGFIALIALVIAIQGAVFVWLVGRADDLTTRDQARRLTITRAVSKAMAAALEASPPQDPVAAMAQSQGERLFAIMTDGRLLGSRPPRSVVDSVTTEFSWITKGMGTLPASWSTGRYSGVPIMVNGRLAGIVGAIPPTTLERVGPPVLGIGLALLTIGALVSTTVIVWPLLSRLRNLRAAVARLGQGDLMARASAEGADEIAELATDFNAMADELAHRTTAVETSDRLRRQLIADVSHELMTPLTAVLGHLETLAMEEVRLDDTERARQMSVTTREARRLERLIGDLLHAARLESGAIELDVETIRTTELFEELCARHEGECRTRGVRLATTVAADADTLEADPFRIDQALDNLLNNALNHTPDGGAIEIRARRRDGDGAVVLEVSDSGEGVAPEHLPFIFDRFYKAPRSKGPASRGSGLGLSIVKAIVSRHGGQVSAVSAPGQGTTIRIELPAV